MAKQKSSLSAKLGSKGRKAFEKHKDDETVLSGGGSLPAGIEGGIARLRSCKFDTFKKGNFKGEYYFFADAVVLEPKFHGTARCRGKYTKIGPEPMCDTPNRSRETLEDHMDWVLNQLRLLGVDTSALDEDDPGTELEAVAETLTEEQPLFSFRTWIGEPTKAFPNPRVNEVWEGTEGVPEDYEPDEDEEGDDETGGGDEEPEEPEEEEEENEEEEESEEEGEGEEDLDALAEKAEAGDEDAIETLTEKGIEAGLTKKKIQKMDHWSDVVEVINKAQEQEEEEEKEEEEEGSQTFAEMGEAVDDEEDEDGSIEKQLSKAAKAADLDPDDYGTWKELGEALDEGGEEEEEEEEEAIPVKGEVTTYKPPKAKKPVECEIVKVDKKNKTVDLKDLTTEKVYKKVDWDDLEG